MKLISQLERLTSAVTRKPVDKVPVVSFTQTGTLELMDASGAFWPDAHREARAMATLALAAHRLGGLEAVRIPFGLVAEAERLGCKINYHEGKSDYTPTVEAGPPSYERLTIPDLRSGVTGEIISALRICRSRVGFNTPIIVGVTAPFTIAGHVRGINEILLDLILNPDLVRNILDQTWEVTVAFSNELLRSGADFIALIEPTASIIGADFFKEFALPYLKKAIDAIEGPSVLHICGNSLPMMELIVDAGAQGVSIDQTVSVAAASDAVKGRCSIIGNVDPVGVLQLRNEDSVIADCSRILDEGTDVLAPGCGISPYTPTRNLNAMVRARDSKVSRSSARRS